MTARERWCVVPDAGGFFFFNCKRCHRNITNKRPSEHNDVCGGFASVQLPGTYFLSLCP